MPRSISLKVIDFGAFGEQVQLDVVVFGGRAGEHRADQARLEVREHLHGRQRRVALRRESLTVLACRQTAGGTRPARLRSRVFFGSTEPSVTPNRSAALRLAVRKSRMPCSDMMRAASCASARRRFSARGGSFFMFRRSGRCPICGASGDVGIDVLRARSCMSPM